MNIKKLREEQNINDVYKFINKYKNVLTLPDQDVINALYGEKIILIDRYIYNLSDRSIKQFNILKSNENKINLEWVEKNTKIIHYLGRNKPWKKNYHGILKCYYDKYKIGEII
jgi:lipopolysaccharide biosynthesis glycosyltransferase